MGYYTCDALTDAVMSLSENRLYAFLIKFSEWEKNMNVNILYPIDIQVTIQIL